MKDWIRLLKGLDNAAMTRVEATTARVDEREAADVLSIPYERVMQVGLIPVAYTLETTFKPAARKPLESVLHWDQW